MTKVINHTRRLFRPAIISRVANSRGNHHHLLPVGNATVTFDRKVTKRLPLEKAIATKSSSSMSSRQEQDNVIDYYSTSSFEASLNQVLALQRDSPTAMSHHQSLEICVRDFFKV